MECSSRYVRSIPRHGTVLIPVLRPQKTIKFITRKLQHKNPQVQLLALELLDYATNSCDLPLHIQFASLDFTKVIQALLLRRKIHQKVQCYFKLPLMRTGLRKNRLAGAILAHPLRQQARHHQRVRKELQLPEDKVDKVPTEPGFQVRANPEVSASFLPSNILRER